MSLLLLAGIGSLGPILVTVFIIGLFLTGLWYIITKFFPAPLQGYAIALVVIAAIIILIYLLAPYAAGIGK